MFKRQVEIIHRTCDIKIAVGIEPVDEAFALMAQITFDLKILIEAIGDRPTILKLAPEFAMQGRLRQIGDVQW